MQQYTRKQLDDKISSFLSRKMEQYPDLDTFDREAKQSKRSMREHSGIMHSFLPTQMKVQF